MALNFQKLNSERLGDDVVFTSLGEAVKSGMRVEVGKDGHFKMSKGNKPQPYFLVRPDAATRGTAIFISSKLVGLNKNTVASLLEYPVREFKWKDANGNDQRTLRVVNHATETSWKDITAELVDAQNAGQPGRLNLEPSKWSTANKPALIKAIDENGLEIDKTLGLAELRKAVIAELG